MKSQLSTNLKRYMDLRGLSAVKLSEAVGVERQSVYAWLNGQNMNLDKLFEVAKALNCNPETLLFGFKPVYNKILAQAISTVEISLGDRVVDLDSKANLIAYVYEETFLGHELDAERVRRLISLMK